MKTALTSYSNTELTAELARRLTNTPAATTQNPSSTYREQRNVLIVTGVYQPLTKEQRTALLSYTSRKSARQVEDVIYDALHKCIRITTWNASNGQSFRDDHDWLIGKITKKPLCVYWRDRNGNGHVRGLLHKLGISFKAVIRG